MIKSFTKNHKSINNKSFLYNSEIMDNCYHAKKLKLVIFVRAVQIKPLLLKHDKIQPLSQDQYKFNHFHYNGTTL